MRALVTGSGGFAGSHLLDYLLSNTDIEVYGTLYYGIDPVKSQVGRVRFLEADLLEPEHARRVISESKPDMLFHLAGHAGVGDSWGKPWSTFESNVKMTLNLFLAIKEAGLKTRVLVVGSNEEYGSVRPEDLPQSEDTPFRPLNPYGVSKIAQDMLALQFFQSEKMDVVRVRPFNHIGPRQRPGFVVSAFAYQIARIEAGIQPPEIRVGNLTTRRDFTDVRDMVRGYWLAMTKGISGEVYNIGSGKSHPIREVLDILIDACKVKVNVVTDPDRFRPAEVQETLCDATKFRRLTGWKPKIPFRQSVLDTLDYWRRQIETESG